MSRRRKLAQLLPIYARIAWWGLVAPRWIETRELVILQAVIRSERGVLLTVRSDLRGWELPGGNPEPGESDEEALRREVREETGLRIDIERAVGDYVREGFRPHTARVFLCRPAGGKLRSSRETPRVRWFPPDALPATLFPWYRQPIKDALGEASQPVVRRERQGLATVLAAMAIDLRMRWSDDRAG